MCMQIYTIFRHYLKLCSGKVLGQILLDVFHRVFLDSLVLYRGIEVVEYRIERDAPVLDGFEAQSKVWLMLPSFPEVTKISGYCFSAM